MLSVPEHYNSSDSRRLRDDSADNAIVLRIKCKLYPDNLQLSTMKLNPLKAGLRATCDFPGAPFSTKGEILIEDISIYRGECISSSHT